MPEKPVSRAANAQVESISTNETLSTQRPPANTEALATALATFEADSPGLWVGGVLSVSEVDFTFTPNAANRATYKALGGRTLTIHVPFSHIQSVTVEKSFVTNIIRIGVGSFVIRVRCFHAKEMARLIQVDSV